MREAFRKPASQPTKTPPLKYSFGKDKIPPASIGAVLKGLITQQLVEKAISFGVNTVAGAAKGKTLTFDVGNQVLANALNYVVEHTPGWLLAWTGGVNAIRDHIIALLPVEDGASLATSTPTAAGPTTTAPAVAG